jgi:hypothetical protein
MAARTERWTLNHLIQTCRDGERGFRYAANHATSPDPSDSKRRAQSGCLRSAVCQDPATVEHVNCAVRRRTAPAASVSTPSSPHYTGHCKADGYRGAREGARRVLCCPSGLKD